MSPRLAISVCGIPLKNPVLAASGTYGYGVEFKGLVELAELGVAYSPVLTPYMKAPPTVKTFLILTAPVRAPHYRVWLHYY